VPESRIQPAGWTPSSEVLKRVLFVCVENSNRSQMAEAFARIHGKGTISAYSAGSKPSGQVNPKAVESMRELGYDLSQHRSKSLSEIPDLEYDVVITMGCGDECPFVRARHREDWEIPDPKALPKEGLRAVRDLIESKVKTLLDLRSK
jgi:arsenate reductase (thioredoxin)